MHGMARFQLRRWITAALAASIVSSGSSCALREQATVVDVAEADARVRNDVGILADDYMAQARTSDKLLPRTPWPKTYRGSPGDDQRVSGTQLVIKFRDGIPMRVLQGTFAIASGPDRIGAGSQQGLPGVDEVRVAQEVSVVNQALARIGDVQVVPLFSRQTNAELWNLKRQAEARTGREQADLSQYFMILLPSPSPARLSQFIAAASPSVIVETVYLQPVPSGADLPPRTTVDLRSTQRYLRAAPTGIDGDFARAQRGGRGSAQINIVDIEGGWNFDHEDISQVPLISAHGVNLVGKDHGTAVAGVLWAAENDFGIDGMVPYTGRGYSSVVAAQFPNFVYMPAAAILNAASDLNPGDIILIEQHLGDFGTGVACPADCNPEQCGFLPMERFGAEFDAIATAVGRGIIVIEAAGNGQQNLDDPYFAGAFDRNVRDSGAIMVGASVGNGSLFPACFTNHGTRVDVHGWGGGVATLGYGPTDSLRANGADASQWYTTSFGGTSSASAIIAGAAALVQSARVEQGLSRLSPAAMRSLLMSTGTPQTPGVPIGPQPDLRRALRATLKDRALSASLALPSQAAPNEAMSGRATFRNDGPFSWSATTHPIRCQWTTEKPAPEVAIETYAGPIDRPSTVSVRFDTSAPTTAGVHRVVCEMVSVAEDTVLATSVAHTLVSAANEFNATIEDFPLPATMIYMRDGTTQPVTVQVRVRNTGTSSWVPGFGSEEIALRLSRLGEEVFPVPRSVAPGEATVFSVQVECPREGKFNPFVQMQKGGAAFGAPSSRATTCQAKGKNPSGPP